jgi:tRNA dimethylallyltransferase
VILSDSTGHLVSLPIICGPTAVGKTALSLELAEKFNGEIISADSRQIYRLMDVGTAKPTLEEQQRVPHHLIDVAWPDEEFNAAKYIEMAGAAIEDVTQREKSAFLVGGTGLYIKALTEGLLDAPGSDPKLRRQLHDRAEVEGSAVLHAELAGVDKVSAERLHPNDLVRIVRALEVFCQSGKPLSELQDAHGFRSERYRTIKIGLVCERSLLYERIERRADLMFEEGLLDEAERIQTAGYDPKLKILRTIGYRQAFACLHGKMSREEALEDLKRATRRYAKQQLTWFRKDKSIIWLESSADFDKLKKLIDNFYVI